jgi:hypothetical protein
MNDLMMMNDEWWVLVIGFLCVLGYWVVVGCFVVC